jgi:basic membrane protein A
MTYLNRRKAIGVIGAAAGSLLSTQAFAQAPKRIAFLLNGTPGSVGWNYEHARGIQQVKDAFGATVQIESIYDVQEWGNGDADKMRELVAQGFDMIVGCSFGYMQSMIQVSFEAPNTLFEHCGGYVRSGNLSTYSARWYEGRVPQGLIAGAMTKTNRIGYLASFPIPQILRGINAAHLAAKSVNPDVEFDVVWLNSWFSLEKEEEVSRMLIERGADILMAHTNSTKPTEVAEEMGAYAFGQASDMSQFGPTATLSATVNNWGPYYMRRIAAMLDGTWATADTWGGFAEEMIEMGEFSADIPNRVFLQATDAVNRLASGQMSPFEGPVRRQNSSGWLAPGEKASDSDLLTMNFFVEDLKGVIPAKN